MVDNVTADPGSGGAVFATDEIASVHYPITKLTFGALDAQTIASSGAGNVDAGTQRVVLASDQAVVSTNWNGTAPPIGAGLEATALRVTLATDSTGVLSVDDNGSSLTVDNPALSVTGGGVEASALRVTLANDSTGVLSVDDGGSSLTVDNAALAVTGGGLEASALRVTLASDSTGVLSVDDGGASLTVDNAGLTALDGAISGTEVQADIVASLPAGTNAIGKLAANSGVDIGDVDVTSISAGSNLVGDVGLSGARTSGGTTLYRNVDVDETEDQIKGTAGQLYWLHAMNLTAAVLYLQFYNATAASVTVGTTTPDLTFPLPTQGDTNGAGFTLAIPNGVAFGTAITVACTTTFGGAAGPAANGCFVNLGYA